VTTAGVAAVAALEVVGCRENQVRTFVVEVFWAEFLAKGFRLLWSFVDIFWLCHLRLGFLSFYSFSIVD
jgi:hypothetical protein